MDEIAARRAEKAGDNHLWSPEDALENALRRVREQSNVKGLIVSWWEDNGESGFTHHYSVSRCSRPETLGLFYAALSRFLHDWVHC